MRQWANLDVLRSVAVLLVAGSHLLLYNGYAGRLGWSGLTGVCFFFVHTSLVLMWSLERDPHVGRFYIRRAFRIYPLWLAVLALVLLVHIPIAPPAAPHFGFHMPHGMELVAEILLLFNLRYGANVVGASWSLPIEVQMYVLLPFLFFFIRSVRKLWPLLMLDGFAMVHAYFTPGPIPPNAGTALLVCVPYFVPGVMAYHLSKKAQPWIPSWLFLPFLGVLITIAFWYGSIRGSWAVCLVVGLAVPYFRQIEWKPLVRCCHLIARYSYGIYLCHFIAIATGYYYLRQYGSAVHRMAFLVTVVVLPVLFYHLLEEPMIRLGAKLAKKIERGRAPALNEEALNLEPAP